MFSVQTTHRGPRHVLIVDDDQDLLDVLRMALEDPGIELAVAHDAETAWKGLKADRLDHMVLDLSIAELDVAAYLQEARGRFPHAQIMVLSGLGPGGREAVYPEGSVDLHLEKPIPLGKLKAILMGEAETAD